MCPAPWSGLGPTLASTCSGQGAVMPWAEAGAGRGPWRGGSVSPGAGGQLRRPGSGLGQHRLSSQGHVLGSHRWCRPVVQVSMITFSSQAHDVP